MGSLSNLYISQSYQSLIHLGTDAGASGQPTELQDGLGTNIGVYVNTNGEVSASSFSGSIAGIGNVSAFSSSVNSRILAITSSAINTGSLVTTASFNSYTSSQDFKNTTFATTSSLTNLSASLYFTDTTQSVNIASISTSVGLLQTFSGSQYKNDSSSFDNRINAITASGGGVSVGTFNSYTASQDFKNTTFATTGSNTFVGNQTITGSLFVSGSEVVTGTLSASALRVENNTHLDGTLRVTNDAQFDGHILIQGAAPHLKLRDTSGGGFSSGYDVRVDTGSFEIYDDTHNRDVLSDFFNSASQQHTTSLTSEIIVISGSTSVTLLGNVSASIISASSINGLGDPLAFSTSVNSRLIAATGSTINTGSFATTGSNSFTGSQTINGNIILTGSSAEIRNAKGVGIFNSLYNLDYELAMPIQNTIGYIDELNLPHYYNGGVQPTISASATINNHHLVKVTPQQSFNLTASVGDNHFGILSVEQLTGWDDINNSFGVHGNLVTSGSVNYITQRGLSKIGIFKLGGTTAEPYIGQPVYVSDNGYELQAAYPTGSRVLRYGYVASFEQSDPLNMYVRQIYVDPVWEKGETITDLNVSSSLRITGSLNVTGSTTFVGNQLITGSLIISSSNAVDLIVTGAVQTTGNIVSSGSNGSATLGALQLSFSSPAQLSSAFIGRNVIRQVSGSNSIGMGANPNQSSLVVGLTDPSILISSGSTTVYYAPIRFQGGEQYTDGRVNFVTPISASAGIVGNTSLTGSLILSSSNAVELQVMGAVEITGSVAGNIIALSVASSTASIDFNLGTFFTLTIPSSTITYITGSNLKPGMTANIILTQQATTGSVRFESSLFKFPSGSINTGSAVASAVDLVSVMSVGTTTLYSVGANQLI
jgi:hypothetical protein